LELAAERVEPRLSDFRADLEAAADAPAILAGSGAAYAVLLATDSPTEATALARRLSRRLKVPVVGTRAVTHGVRLSACRETAAPKGGRPSDPAGDAASGSSSTASCASSCASACGAS